MRLVKGSKVEVHCKEDCVAGWWRSAEIVSGNGRTYNVRFRFSTTSDYAVGRVPRKDIRPCPPYLDWADQWASGDLIEVFDDLSWKTGSIVRSIDASTYLVKLLFIPTLLEIIVHKSHIRVRLCIQDDKWFFVGKGTQNCILTLTNKKTGKQCDGDDYLLGEEDIGRLDPQMVSTITRKRGSPFHSSRVDSYPVVAKKMRISIEDGGHHQIFPGLPLTSHEKVDTSVFSQKKCIGGKHMQASLNKAEGSVDLNRFSDNYGERNLIANDSDSCQSSVASCSVNETSPHYTSRNIRHYDIDTEGYISDAESSCGREYEYEGCPPPPMELVGEVCRSESSVYQCNVESWMNNLVHFVSLAADGVQSSLNLLMLLQYFL